MQPTWSPVMAKDGSVDYGLSYHRAFYSKDYDDFHNIYLQRRVSGATERGALDLQPWSP